MNDQNSFVQQETRTVQVIFDTADGTTTTATTDEELVLLDRETGSKLFLHRIPHVRTGDGTVTKITDTLFCRSCNTTISHHASTRCTHCRATTCVSCAGQLHECKACQNAQWWPRFWVWLCSV